MNKLSILKNILTSGASVFKCNFIKKNGEKREMICKFESFHQTCENLVIVYDLQKDEFRNINLETLIDLTIDRKKMSFQTL